MGCGTYTNEEAKSFRSTRGVDPFAHTKAIASGTIAAGLHPSLDPKKLNTVGIKIRECLDSPEHPESLAIVFGLDVTGSMSIIPRQIIDKLPIFFTALLEKGFVKHPAVCFGAIGDGNSDKAPLQVTQFESDIKGFEQLANVWLERGGGGTAAESYELFMYFMGKYSKLDCFDKRGQKGFLFIIGDELATSIAPEATRYDIKPENYNWELSKFHVRDIIGDTIESNIPFNKVLETLQEKYEVCWIYPKEASYFIGYPQIHNHWKNVFGENYYELAKTEEFVELVIMIIAAKLGYSLAEIADGLTKAGASASSIANATAALSTKVMSSTLVATATTSGALIDASGVAPEDE